MTIKTDSESDFVPLNANNNNSNDELTKDDFKLLKEFINPLYLTRKCIKDINIQFCENSSLQLNDFLKSNCGSEWPNNNNNNNYNYNYNNDIYCMSFKLKY